MRFGKLLKDAAYNPLFSISYKKGFWRSTDVLSCHLWVINIHWWCFSRCERRILWLWRFGCVRLGQWGWTVEFERWGCRGSRHREMFIILQEMSHKYSWTSWLTEASNPAQIYQQHNPNFKQKDDRHIFARGTWGIPAELCGSAACWWWTLIYNYLFFRCFY